MIFESAVFSDERYILDDRQLYLLREAPRQMTIYALGDLRDLWKHDDYLADHFDFTGIYEPDPVDEKFDIIADRTAKMLRSIIKKLVDKHTKNPWDRMHEFDVDYDGLIVTDVEYQSLLALPDDWLLTFLRHVVNLSNTYLDGLLDTVRLVVTAYSPNIYRRSVRCLSQRGRFGGREPGSPSINQNHTTTIMKISDYCQIQLSFFSAKIKNCEIPLLSRVFKFDL